MAEATDNLDYATLAGFIKDNVVDPFYANRFARLKNVKLNEMLKRKNPYLFKAKNIQTAEQLVRQVLDAYLSSGEETAFGTYLEQLSIHVNGLVYGGHKSSGNGIDLEFDKEGIHYLVAIKSGPNWGNSDQIARMRTNFSTAKRILGTNSSAQNVVSVNGCCYGKDNNPDKGDYLKLCGQRYWEFISGDDHLFLEMIDPLDQIAQERDEQFDEEYARKVNEMTASMLSDFCADGLIDWEKLVTYNSGR